MIDTYLKANIKDVGLIRWPTSPNPILVHIAPFHWYQKEKQDNAKRYEYMVWHGFELWSQYSKGLIRFQRVATLQESQINIVWRRVDRKSLGHCEYSWNPQGQLYSAEISIGLTDGTVHGYYDNPEEVRRTILHEIGHALGLGHSNHVRDIMYPVHQIGVNQLSARDLHTLEWLYRVPPGFDYVSEAHRLNLPPDSQIDYVLEALFTPPSPPPSFEDVLESVQESKPTGLDIHAQQDLLTQKGRYLMATSLIEIAPPAILPPPPPLKLKKPPLPPPQKP